MAMFYDAIGEQYSQRRQADPRIALAIEGSIEGCGSILNVGAGAGSYEPRSHSVIAVEPSWTMIAQRRADAAPVARAVAEALPFADRSFDAVLAVLTMHHWGDQTRGLAECARVARQRVALVTIDPEVLARFWLYQYFPRLWDAECHVFPAIERLREVMGPIDVTPLPVPADCVDGFLGAYWRRPAAYLDPVVRACISTFFKISQEDTLAGIDKLRTDIESGAWLARNAAIKDRDSLDVGYRIVVRSR